MARPLHVAWTRIVWGWLTWRYLRSQSGKVRGGSYIFSGFIYSSQGNGESGKGLETMNMLCRRSQGVWNLDKEEEQSRTQTKQVERSRGRENKLLWQRRKKETGFQRCLGLVAIR